MYLTASSTSFGELGKGVMFWLLYVGSDRDAFVSRRDVETDAHAVMQNAAWLDRNLKVNTRCMSL
jgi:hypothetical protein